MSELIRIIVNGAGRMLDMSGSNVNRAYSQILLRRELRSLNASLSDDLEAIGSDMIRAMNSVACELADEQKSEEQNRICH